MGIIEARKIVKRWQKNLGLQPFKISIEFGRTSRHDFATVDISLEEHTADIRLNPSKKNELTEEIILHELIHILLYRLWAYVEVVVERISSDALSRKTLEAEYEVMEEEIVNRLAKIVLRTRASHR